MKRKIILHGYLKRLYPEPIEVESETVGEAIRSLQNIPELVREDGSPHPVRVDGIDSEIALFSKSSVDVIHIRPRTGGAGGRGGLFQVLLGIALIALSFAFPLGIAIGAATIGTSGFFLTGALMVLGGVMQMLLPVPETREGQSSKYLGSSENTTQVGTRIPLIYGTRRKGGHYLSFDVDSADIGSQSMLSTPPETNYGGGFGSDHRELPFTGTEETSVGSLGAAGAAVTGHYFVHDITPLSKPRAPVNPVYASATPSAGGNPISSWGP